MFKKKFLIIYILSAALLAGCTAVPVEPEVTIPEVTAAPTEPEVTDPPTELETEPPTEPETEPETEAVTEPLPEPGDADFVKIIDYIPDVVIDLRYSTENNHTGKVIYDFEDIWLRYGTVKKLMKVQEKLKEDGYRLKIWDGFRPTYAQFRLWEACPDARYVANPYVEFSNHSRGNTIDLTIVYADGNEVLMPTEFDNTTPMADRVYDDCSPDAAHNSQYLENIMVSCGFWGYWGEWWHYTDNTRYPVEEVFNPGDLP